MPYVNPFTGTSGAGPTPTRASRPFVTAGSPRLAPLAGSGQQAGQSRGRGFPERIQLDNPFHQASQTAVDVFAAAGQLPGQILETPVSALDNISRFLTSPGDPSRGFSPIQAIGQIPGVGASVDFLGEALERTGNFMPAFMNAADARMILEFGDKPDDTELPWHSGQRAEGVPILGAIPGLQMLFSRAKTVGELKRELEQRGFLNDPRTGESRTWQQVVAGLRGGTMSVHDFGYASINDNPLVDLGGRIGADPLNALFLIPGGAAVKGAAGAARVVKGAEAVADARQILRPSVNLTPQMERAGLRAPQLPPPVTAKAAVATGDISRTTIRGIASFYKDILSYPTSAALKAAVAVGKRAGDPRGYLGLTDAPLTATSRLGRAGQAAARGARGYALSSTALSGAMGVTGHVSGMVDDALGGNTYFQGIHDFVLDVEQDNPLSENAAWMIASAFSFPYGDVARGAKAGVARGALDAFGNDFEVALAGKFGFGKGRQGIQAFREAIGGPEAVNRLIAYLVKHEAATNLRRRPLLGARVQSAPSAALKAHWADETLASTALMRLRGNKVNGERLVEMLEDWHSEQMGFKRRGGKGDEQLVGDPRRAPFVPELALRRWKRFDTAQSTVGRGLQEMADGVLGLGLRDHLFREQFGEIRNRLQAAVGDDGIVPQAVLRELLEDYPALAISDPTGYWKNAVLDDARPLTWNSVRAKLGKQGKHAQSIDELLGESALKESRAGVDDAPSAIEPIDERLARLADELEQHRGPDGEIIDSPRSQTIRAEISETLARDIEVRAVRRAVTDEAQVGKDGAQALSRMERQQELFPEIPLHESLTEQPGGMRDIAMDWERAILAVDPTYTIKALPKNQLLVQMRPSDSAIYHALKARTLLGELMFDRGPIAPLTGFMHSLLKPVKGHRLAIQTRQALYGRTLPDGAKPEQVNQWIAIMQRDADKFSFEARGQRFGLFRDVSSLPASAINRAAREAFGENSKIVAKWDGRFHDLLDKASSRMWRGIRQDIREGGRRGQLARAVDRFHDFYLEEGAVISTPTRLVGKTFYNMFRFLMDPRWIALNLAERNFLGGAEDGILRGAREESAASAFYANGARRIDDMALANMTGDTGWYYGRGIMSHVGRSFDARRIDSTVETLNALAKTDAAQLNTIRTRIRREAESELAAARKAREAGQMDQAAFNRIEKRATLDIENSNRDLAVLLDEQLYNFDQKGVRKTIQDEAKALLDADELTAMSPLLDALYEQNEAIWADVNRLYLGNPERNTLERLLNSYWLYWPISYQLKATKWLAGAMLDGSFGHNNNALLAGRYAVWKEQHEERMANNPAYAAMFEENPDLWFMAGMVLPITPEDIGVSLSRPARLAGSFFGAFSEYKQVQGPASAAAYITNLGPIYTWHLMQSLEADARGVKFVPGFATSPDPDAAAAEAAPSLDSLPSQFELPAPLAPSIP